MVDLYGSVTGLSLCAISSDDVTTSHQSCNNVTTGAAGATIPCNSQTANDNHSPLTPLTMTTTNDNNILTPLTTTTANQPTASVESDDIAASSAVCLYYVCAGPALGVFEVFD